MTRKSTPKKARKTPSRPALPEKTKPPAQTKVEKAEDKLITQLDEGPMDA